jgi:hypothetical protein
MDVCLRNRINSHRVSGGVFVPGARRKDGGCGRETLRDFVELTQF